MPPALHNSVLRDPVHCQKAGCASYHLWLKGNGAAIPPGGFSDFRPFPSGRVPTLPVETGTNFSGQFPRVGTGLFFLEGFVIGSQARPQRPVKRPGFAFCLKAGEHPSSKFVTCGPSFRLQPSFEIELARQIVCRGSRAREPRFIAWPAQAAPAGGEGMREKLRRAIGWKALIGERPWPRAPCAAPPRGKPACGV